MAWQRRAGKQTQPAELGRCRQTQPADDLPGTGLVAKQQPQTTLAGLSPCSAGRWREYGGAGTQEAGSDLLTCLPPTYRLCLSPSLPTPLICKTQFSPNLFFCCFYLHLSLYFPTRNRPLTPFTVCVRLTYPVPSLLPTPTFPSRRGIREG